MRISYSVTFEFETRAPMTHRGVAEAAQPATCFARAVREAQRALKPKGWMSIVCVLDRGDFGAEARPQTTNGQDAV